MAFRHLFQRFSPTLDGRWVILALVLLVLAGLGTFIRWSGAAPPIDLVALGPDGRFQDTLIVPLEWGDTATHTPDAVARVPLILGVRNRGRRPVTPDSLSLSVPLRYRLTRGSGQELDGRTAAGSPLITYTLDPELEAIEPQRLPVLLPAHDTIWLEVVMPKYYCVALGDSVPEFVPAPPPPLHTMSSVRIFYSFEGQTMGERRTGTLAVHMDSSLLTVATPPAVPSYAMVNDAELASPELGALMRVGSRRSQCGEPGSAMELLSSVWETPDGGLFITLDYGGTVRKHLFDLDNDGIIERESWATGSRQAFTATRRTELPIPAFLLPVPESGEYDLARIDSLPPDSAARLDPFRGAMDGPGPVPGGSVGPAADSVRRARVEPIPDTLPSLESLPEPRIRPVGPIGRPIQLDSTRRN